MLVQFVKNCSLQEGLTLEKFMENCLLWEAPYAGAGEECEASVTNCDKLTSTPISCAAAEEEEKWGVKLGL